MNDILSYALINFKDASCHHVTALMYAAQKNHANVAEWLLDKPVCNTSNPKKYRSMDGSCNNLKETNYGRAFTPFFRILDAEYAPGTINGPRLAKDGTDLPSARLLSTTGQNTINLVTYI